MGAYEMEFDVQMTKDGYLVVTHDEEISRVSDESGYVKDYTFQKLRCFSSIECIRNMRILKSCCLKMF